MHCLASGKANNKAVLSDVGIAAFLKDEEACRIISCGNYGLTRPRPEVLQAMQRRVGSPGYAPPEVVTDLPYVAWPKIATVS